MKIVFTGGGTGGHFYPIIAVAERVNQIIDHENILGVKLYYISNDPYDPEMLFENGLLYEQVSAGKMRTHPSVGNFFKNFFDSFKVALGTINAIFKLFSIYPDVVFGKGGYGSFPTLAAARFLSIPIIIHESDSVPGRVNKWAGRFARKVAISFEEAAHHFPKIKTAWTGQPIRMEIEEKSERNEALSYFKFESNLPTILILGGSQGAELINNAIVDAVPRLVKNYQVIHQSGVRNHKAVVSQTDLLLAKDPNRLRYYSTPFLNPLAMKMAAGAADIVISRAGSTVFEIAAWGLPSILVPFTQSNADHSKQNAFNYARTGACSVIEEINLTANILLTELERILGDKRTIDHMAQSARKFYKPDAATKIAHELIDIALSHEK